MINADGEVIGVNSAIFSQTGSNVGIGFAIPIDLAKKVVDQLRKNGRVVRGWLGVRAQDVTPAMVMSLGLTRNPGEMAVVTEVVEKSPAADAGVKNGDVIVEFNGKAVPKSHDFPTVIADIAPGQKITLKIVREKKEGELLGSKLASCQTKVTPVRPKRATPSLVCVFSGLRRKRRAASVWSSAKGVLVVEVQPGSPADRWASTGRCNPRNQPAAGEQCQRV